MNMHETDLKSRLVRFLNRKQMPRRLEGKASATEDEIAALAGALTRNAPRSSAALPDWWPIFEARLGEICGSMWPTEKEIRDAAKQASQEAPTPSGPTFDGKDMREVAVTSRKMLAGEPVGETALWGRLAVEMIAEGLVSRELMERYRKGAFWNRVGSRHVSDEARETATAAARAWEAEAKARHEAASHVWRNRNEPTEPRYTRAPNKSVSDELSRAVA